MYTSFLEQMGKAYSPAKIKGASARGCRGDGGGGIAVVVVWALWTSDGAVETICQLPGSCRGPRS